MAVEPQLLSGAALQSPPPEVELWATVGDHLVRGGSAAFAWTRIDTGRGMLAGAGPWTSDSRRCAHRGAMKASGFRVGLTHQTDNSPHFPP
jgi:hypothetical protein